MYVYVLEYVIYRYKRQRNWLIHFVFMFHELNIVQSSNFMHCQLLIGYVRMSVKFRTEFGFKLKFGCKSLSRFFKCNPGFVLHILWCLNIYIL